MNLNHRLGKYSTWVALVIFLVVILVTFQNLFLDDLNNDPSRWGDGWSMEYNWSVQVSEGIPLYPEESNFIEGSSLAYMPLYFLVVGSLMKVFGLSAVIGKLVSVLCILGVALLIYKVGVSITSRRYLSTIPSILFLLYPAISNYTSEQMKIEPLGLLLSTVSLYLVLNKKYLWAVPFAVLAFFTKQYFIGVPIAVSVFLVWRDRRTLVRYLSLYVVLIITGFGIGQYLTGGTFFTHTVLFMFAPQFGSLTLDRNVVGTLICLGYLVPVLLIAVYGMWKSGRFGLLGIYLVVSLLVLVVTIGKVGSGINYTFDALVASCCLSALALRRKSAIT